jgi:hypothetical protein
MTMRRRFFALAVFGWLAAAPACGGSTGAGATGTGAAGSSTSTGGGSFSVACDQPGPGHTCTLYSFPDQATVDGESMDCKAHGGMALDACPTQNLVGVCDAFGLSTYSYSDGGATAASAEQLCTSAGGTFHM